MSKKPKEVLCECCAASNITKTCLIYIRQKFSSQYIPGRTVFQQLKSSPLAIICIKPVYRASVHTMECKIVFIAKFKKKGFFLTVRLLLTCQNNVGNSSDFLSLVKVWKIHNETGVNCKMRTKRNVLYYVMLGIFLYRW